MTQTVPILSLEGDSPCDREIADVTLNSVFSHTERKGMGAKRSPPLMPLSYPGGELSKQTISLYVIDQTEVTCPLWDHSLAKEKAFPWMAWIIPVAGHLATKIRKRGLAVGRQPIVPAILTLCLLSRLASCFFSSLCQEVFPDLYPFVQHTLFYHVIEQCSIQVTVYFDKVSHLFVSKSCLLNL